MTKYEIIERLATERKVETFVQNIARRPLTAELKDLCQIVYVILLEYREDKIIELYEDGEIDYFIARVIINQYSSKTSTFYYQLMRYVDKAAELREYREGDQDSPRTP